MSVHPWPRAAATLALALTAGAVRADACDDGYVWREAFPGDRVCVTPAVREQAARDNAAAAGRWVPGPHGPDECQPQYVWREATPSDRVCVTPGGRDLIRVENREAPSRTGSAATTAGGARACLPGFVWRAAAPGDATCVPPAARDRVRAENALADGRRGSRACAPGFVWREASPSDHVCVAPRVREQARADDEAHRRGIRLRGVACDAYAREAAAQHREASATGCRTSGGPRWQDDVANHHFWCHFQARREDREDEAAARRDELRRCREAAGGAGGPGAAGAACSVSVTARVGACLNLDGSASSIQAGSLSAAGCAGGEELAKLTALANLAGQACLTAGDAPAPGCCTFTTETVAGCLCR
jgi:hypothetical protein